jgi:hypothetical protein
VIATRKIANGKFVAIQAEGETYLQIARWPIEFRQWRAPSPGLAKALPVVNMPWDMRCHMTVR